MCYRKNVVLEIRLCLAINAIIAPSLKRPPTKLQRRVCRLHAVQKWTGELNRPSRTVLACLQPSGYILCSCIVGSDTRARVSCPPPSPHTTAHCSGFRPFPTPARCSTVSLPPGSATIQAWSSYQASASLHEQKKNSSFFARTDRGFSRQISCLFFVAASDFNARLGGPH